MSPRVGRPRLQDEVRPIDGDERCGWFHGEDVVGRARRDDPVVLRSQHEQRTIESLELRRDVGGEHGGDAIGENPWWHGCGRFAGCECDRCITAGEEVAHQHERWLAREHEPRYVREDTRQRRRDEARAQDDGGHPRAAIGDEQREWAGERLGDERERFGWSAIEDVVGEFGVGAGAIARQREWMQCEGGRCRRDEGCKELRSTVEAREQYRWRGGHVGGV